MEALELSRAVRLTLGILGGAAVAVFGPPLAPVLVALLALMLMDLVSAVIANGRRGKLDPTAGWAGWKRKVNTLLIVLGVAILFQVAESTGIKDLASVPVPTAVAAGFALIELLSIIRNGLATGVRMPPILAGAYAQWLTSLRDKPSDHRETG